MLLCFPYSDNFILSSGMGKSQFFWEGGLPVVEERLGRGGEGSDRAREELGARGEHQSKVSRKQFLLRLLGRALFLCFSFLSSRREHVS